MSFFTKEEFASFHHPQAIASSMDNPISPSNMKLPLKQQTSLQRRVDNSSFTSTTSSNASTISEFDPLSPMNLQRDGDPWYGNTLVASTNPSSGQMKVFMEEQLDLDGEEWGDFITFGSKPEVNAILNDQEEDKASSKGNRRAKHSSNYLQQEESMSAQQGWQSLPLTYSSCRDDDVDLLSDRVDTRAYQPHYTDQPTQPPRQEETQSFAKTILTRLASFSNSSNVSRTNSMTTNPSPPPLPRRNYDSYDVTFEHGPIGLELETDWYGRQAVVKGFKKIIEDGKEVDGPAKLCGIIRIGDVLTAINGISCLELSFPQTLQQLRQVSSEKHILHFKSLEVAGDLSLYTLDADIIQAKKWIHAHKERFYHPLESKTELILGCIERLRGESVTSFNFHREDTGEFLLACSCVNEKTGNFIFHTLKDAHLRSFKDLPQSEDSAVYLGMMIPNFLGTEYTLVDHQQKRRNEMAFIEYDTNVLGRVPNTLRVCFPKLTRMNGEEAEEEEDMIRPRAATTGTGMGSNNAMFNTHRTTNMMDRNGAISDRYKRLRQTRSFSIVERIRSFSLNDLEGTLDQSGRVLAALYDDKEKPDEPRAMRLQTNKRIEHRSSMSQDTATAYGAVEQDEYDSDLITFETRQPSWNEQLGAWTLNFKGRVKLASKKNFLVGAQAGNEAMEAEFGEETVYLRFGKVTSTRFALDHQAPISPFLALAIACSSFAHKIAVT